MPRPPKVDHVRDEFVKAVESAVKLYDQVQKVGTIKSSTNCERLHVEHVRRVIELSFMGIVSAWEEFIEQSLVRYLAGAVTGSGYQPHLRLGPARSISHAYQILTANPQHDPANRYVSWNEPNALAKQISLYFHDGAPYAHPLRTNSQRLAAASTLRNRVAHSSEKCREDFKVVARRFKNLAKNANLTQGYRVGDLLTEKAERGFGNRPKNKGWTFFQAYCECYKEAARAIVP